MIKFIKYMAIVVLLMTISSCSDYLDVVPDNTVELESIFETKEKAFSALAACYSFIPNRNHVDESLNLAGDEFLGRLDPSMANNRGRLRGTKIMRGWQSSNDPILGYWEGSNGARSLYNGIRTCNNFLDNISLVPDLTETERKDWISQVKFMKAYYHFYLINIYGPIIIADESIDPDNGLEEVRQFRQPVDSCFNYVEKLIDEALIDLPDSRSLNFMGQINKTIAMSIKARVLMYAASPLFNGNSEYYGSFTDKKGVNYFNMSYDNEKWKKALDATEAAILQAENAGKSLYEYDQAVKFFDKDDWDLSGVMKYAHNNRYSIIDSWNSELIWGYSNISNRSSVYTLQAATNLRKINSTNYNHSWQWLGASYRMSELFYTKNGIPINEDLTFDYENRLKLTTIPDDDDYFRGYLQPLQRTVKLHLDREPRFYAWLATDRGVWRAQDSRYDIKMRNGETPGGKAHSTDFYWSGIGVKKFVHPETTSDNWATNIPYAFPLFRMAELYLMRAEARNEYSGPEQSIYYDLNLIRSRAGLPNVESVYSDGSIANNVGKHLDKSGLRDIIQTERMIELCFEGHRYNDIRRWKRGSEFFTSPIKGWNIDKSVSDEFYTLGIKQVREWITPRDYFFPIGLSEMTLNPNLIQNPGWDN